MNEPQRWPFQRERLTILRRLDALAPPEQKFKSRRERIEGAATAYSKRSIWS
jgi:hypothetical protein